MRSERTLRIRCCFAAWIALAGSALSQPVVQTPGSMEPAVVARIGANAVITSEEFLLRYEMTPGLQRQTAGKTEENKQSALLSLIAEKLLAEEGRNRGVMSEPKFREAVHEVERLLVRDELYRREVRSRVVLDPDEVDAALRLSKKNLTVSLISSETAEGAAFIRNCLKAGMHIADLLPDSGARRDFSRPDTLTVRWGEGNPKVEEVCYTLKKGMPSGPVSFDDGTYFFEVIGESAALHSEDEQSERERIEKVLRQRMEEERAFEFMGEVLHGKRFEVDRQLLRGIVDACITIAEAEGRAAQNPFVLTENIVARLAKMLSTIWDRPLVSFPHGTWTVGLALARLRDSGFGIALPVKRNIVASINGRLRGIVFQEELASEGYRMNLDRAPDVTKKLAMWSDSYIAGFVQEALADTMAVRKADIAGYRAGDGGGALSIPLTDIAIISNDSLAQIPGTDGYLLPGELGELRATVEHLAIGERSEPVAFRGKIVTVQLVDRQGVRCRAKDTVNAGAALRGAILASRRKDLRDRFVGRLADRYGVIVDHDQLHRISVTHIPALYYQLLGFGGRMLAVPLLDNDSDWLLYCGSARSVLP